ncbi:MAG: hypothetical protein LBT86_10020 [Deltaproteobacteria bacterium]|jgi:hypothetical protein|nr:hypothetical protein [Deltaproteobacteria bacterium]
MKESQRVASNAAPQSGLDAFQPPEAFAEFPKQASNESFWAKLSITKLAITKLATIKLATIKLATIKLATSFKE